MKAEDERIARHSPAEALLDSALQTQTRAEHAHLAVVLDSLTEGVVIFDLAARVLQMNSAALDLHGFTDPEEARRELAEFADLFEVRSLAGAALPVSEWPVRRTLRGETFSELELQVRRKDTGRTLTVAYSGTAVRDGSGTPILGVLTMRDVTARRQTEDELVKFRFFSEHANDGLVLFDERMRIRYANRAFCERLGYTAAELMLLTVPDIDPLYPVDRLRELFERAKQELIPPFEGLHRRRDGRTFPVEVTVAALQFGGEWLMVGSSRDITERKRADQALRDSEGQLAAIFEHAAIGIVHTILPYRRVLRANEAFCRIVGYSRTELVGKASSELTHPDDVAIGNEQYAKLLTGEIKSFTMDKRYVRKDGRIVWARTTVSAVRNESGTDHFAIVLIEDITEARVAERLRQMAERRLELAVGIAELGFWEVDLRTGETYFSPEYKKQLGYDDPEMPNTHEEWTSRLHPEEREAVLARQEEYVRSQGRHAQRSEFEQEFRLRHRDGSYRWIASRMTAVRDEHGNAIQLMGTHLDVTARKDMENRIREISQHDALTGLPNRTLIYEFAEVLLSRARRSGTGAAFLFVDMDRFKPINDTYGHGVGDAVLKQVGRRLRGCVRGEDLVGRLGGDEFLVVLSQIRSHDNPAKIARHALKRLQRPYRTGGLELSVSPSIGISVFPEDGEDVDELIRNADTAMYYAKEYGRNTFQFFKREHNERAAQALRIETRLRKALDEREFVLNYQAVIDVTTEAVVGAEALLRWPQMAAPPDEFIPVAEKAGLMPRLGTWVLTEACRQRRRWNDAGLPSFPVAVNVSPIQFRQKNWAQAVSAVLAACQTEPGCLRIEVTESTVMTNHQEAAAVLRTLREMGVEVALDDFGSGYSSLSSLSQLPIDILKIDKSFVQAVGRDRASMAIAEGIIALGQSLGLEVVAEGVETADALAFLRNRNCGRAQGYYFCRPLPADEFERWYCNRAR